jgi:hypothetical protein
MPASGDLLVFQGTKADAIKDKLKDYFSAAAPPYSTVTYWCRKL